MSLDDFKQSDKTTNQLDREDNWDNETKLEAIKKIHEQHNRVDYDLVQSIEDIPSVGTYRYNYGSLAEAQIKAGINVSEIQDVAKCESCDTHYQNIAKHWSQSSCSQNSISDKQKEFLIGHLMGDATLTGRNRKSPSMKWNMANKEYMLWLDEKLGWISTQIKVYQTSDEASKALNNSDFASGDDYNAKTLYNGGTHGHKWLNNLNWYDTGEKRFPKDLSLTKNIIKIWYCDDGGLKWSGAGKRAPAHIHMSSQPESTKHLKQEFSKFGLDPTITKSNDGLTFSAEDTENLLDLIGNPPSGMGYKWENEIQERYNRIRR
jgi:hypothetical protein